MVNTNRLEILISAYLENNISDIDALELSSYLEDPAYTERIKILLGDHFNKVEPTYLSAAEQNTLLASIYNEQEQLEVKNKSILFSRLWPKIAVAAAIVLSIFGAYLFYFNNQQHSSHIQEYANEVSPGKNGATLTLANGRTITIGNAQSGEIAKQSGVTIYKSKNGQLIYEANGSQMNDSAHNTLSTAAGQQTQIRLPDGTLVFLNAASSLLYPVTFKDAKTREVKLIGEGYFEVAKDKHHPFIVTTGTPVVDERAQRIEVLGTHFNVKAYQDEREISTTLVEGAVKVTGKSLHAFLKPGQQARNSTGKLFVENVNQAGMAKVMAWKEGKFDFQDASLKEVMLELSRWYNIEVIYEKGIPDLEFIGQIERTLPLSQVLNGLKLSGVNFKIQGRKVIVSP